MTEQTFNHTQRGSAYSPKRVPRTGD